MAANPSLLDNDDLLNPDNWLSVKELAGILGVAQQSIYNMIDTGANLPPMHRRVGSSRIRFFKPEVRKWLTDPKTFIKMNANPRPADHRTPRTPAEACA